jgi:NTE family protein
MVATILSSPSDTRPSRKIGLALGSGAARGLAHIGVLRAIEEAGIHVDVVAGSSIGALIGAVFVAGNLERLAADFLAFDWKRVALLLDPVFPRTGLIDGKKVANFLRTYAPCANIENLSIPFRAVATDLANGEEVTIGTGDLVEAVRASIAVPGLLTPARSDGRILVDGGLVNPVPVSVAREMGANLIIAVDLSNEVLAHRLSRVKPAANEKRHADAVTHLLQHLQATENPMLAKFRAWLEAKPLPGILDVLLASLFITQARITETTLRRDQPDILIQPPLGKVRFMDFDCAEEIIDIGYRSAVRQLATAQQL